MAIISYLFPALATLAFIYADSICVVEKNNNCVTFNIGPGTGCDWMCNYCATQLGTNNYYFTDGVCTYHEGQGCTGSPVANTEYTCCSA